jgi:hypothetical protein
VLEQASPPLLESKSLGTRRSNIEHVPTSLPLAQDNCTMIAWLQPNGGLPDSESVAGHRAAGFQLT